MTCSLRRRVLALALVPALAAGSAGQALAAGPELPREAYTLSGRDAEPVAHAGLTLAGAADPGRGPNFLALPLAGRSGAALRLAGGDAQGLRWSLGGSWQDQPGQRADLEGSGLSYPFGPGRLYASVERRHWGPSPFGSLILDGAARALPAVGWRKTSGQAFELPVLEWLGPWRTDLFAGRLSNDAGPDDVKLLGWRLEIEPLPGLVLGGSRVLQWGGEGRPQTLGSLLRAIVGIDNFEADMDRSVEPGNQLAGFDARWTLPGEGPTRLTLNGQMIGEDEAGHMPSRYLVGGGGEIAATLQDGTALRVFGELADTQAGRMFRGRGYPGAAYHHSLYPAGYAQRNAPLAYPAGGDVRLASLGLAARRGPARLLLMAHRGSNALRGLAGELRFAVDGGPALALAASEWHDALGRERGLQLRVEIPL
ncbi:capsule assembly Wzi family protein [Piscinibacter sp.]|uniref:capsule assembly Wzi family protein n=1 Tax=Piscinibacter sp. TaxID=1903157 RepID=UPI0039E6A7E6